MIVEVEAVQVQSLEKLLKKYRGQGREALLPLLHEAQAINGWLPREIQEQVSHTLRVPLAEIHGVIEFYSMLYNRPAAKKIYRFCEDPSCYLAGGESVISAVEAALSSTVIDSKSEQMVTMERVPCLGMCDIAPAALVGSESNGNLRPEAVHDLLAGRLETVNLEVTGHPRLITERIDKLDPLSLNDYIDNAGFAVFGKVLQTNPEEIIRVMDKSGILGRGGAMFPLGRKWLFTRAAEGDEKFVVVNGDESEPGTFKDRYLMEKDPFAIVEAAAIAAYAVGAKKGWIFVRGEYPKAYERLRSAVLASRQAGYLGRNILNSGFDFDIEMRLGAGAYICGEETALFSAIEGYRGFPRIKPPFPVTHGLFGKPTAVNNVETLLSALAVLKNGNDAWLSLGTEKSPGTKLFCVSGQVERPGLYELPFGQTVRELLELAGGVQGGSQVQAVLLGGAAGTFIGPEQLDLKLTYEDARQHEVPIGSGVVMIFNEHTDLRMILYQLSRFFAHESCGKCYPCQLGTQRQMEILQSIAGSRRARKSDRQDLIDIGAAMSETSLCGLGISASTAVLSALKIWPELVE